MGAQGARHRGHRGNGEDRTGPPAYGDEDGIAAVSATVPLGRLAEPADVGDACLFLASPLASYVSGADLLLHGGGERPAFLDAAINANHDNIKKGE